MQEVQCAIMGGRQIQGHIFIWRTIIEETIEYNRGLLLREHCLIQALYMWVRGCACSSECWVLCRW